MVSQVPFINKPDTLNDFSIFIISLIHSCEIINVVCFTKSKGCVPRIDASLAAAAVNRNDIKTTLASA